MRPPGVVDPVVTVDPGTVLLELRRSVDPIPDMSKLEELATSPWESFGMNVTDIG